MKVFGGVLEVVNYFNASVIFVKIPLKFLPVMFCGAWDERKSSV